MDVQQIQSGRVLLYVFISSTLYTVCQNLKHLVDVQAEMEMLYTILKSGGMILRF